MVTARTPRAHVRPAQHPRSAATVVSPPGSDGPIGQKHHEGNSKTPEKPQLGVHHDDKEPRAKRTDGRRHSQLVADLVRSHRTTILRTASAPTAEAAAGRRQGVRETTDHGLDIVPSSFVADRT